MYTPGTLASPEIPSTLASPGTPATLGSPVRTLGYGMLGVNYAGMRYTTGTPAATMANGQTYSCNQCAEFAASTNIMSLAPLCMAGATKECCAAVSPFQVEPCVNEMIADLPATYASFKEADPGRLRHRHAAHMPYSCCRCIPCWLPRYIWCWLPHWPLRWPGLP
jgi:hypothetical protein